MSVLIGGILMIVTGWFAAGAGLRWAQALQASMDQPDGGQRGARVVRRGVRLGVLITADHPARLRVTLASLRPQLRGGDRVAVLGDVAQHEFETVRTVDEGLGHLAGVDVVLFLGDGVVAARGALALIAADVFRGGGPVQGLVLPADAGVEAFTERYVRPLGGLRLGLPSPTFGQGFAVPGGSAGRWVGRDLGDPRLALDLAGEGSPVAFQPSTRFVLLPGAGEAQREPVRVMPWAVGHALIGRKWRLAATLFDHGVPRPGVLLSTLAALAVLGVIVGTTTNAAAGWWACSVALFGFAAAWAAVVLGRRLHARRRDLLTTPRQQTAGVAGVLRPPVGTPRARSA